MRGPAWEPWEDALIVEAAALNRKWGRFDPAKPYDGRGVTRRLSALAGPSGKLPHRTEGAVRKRAQRIAERSYTRWEG